MRQPRRKGRAVVEDKGLPSLGPTELLLEGVDLVPPGEGLLLGAREGEVLGLGDVFHFFIIIIFFLQKEEEVEVEFLLFFDDDGCGRNERSIKRALF